MYDAIGNYWPFLRNRLPSYLGFSYTRCHSLEEHNMKDVIDDNDDDDDTNGVDGDGDEWVNIWIAK